ncbi:hypothetical protein O77CONTIG1_03275 [Leptolyngbya sp. O-77]|nr:hypothetical protein O77CONTIG1_03275 [Leptolyngbya sp. O-77]
MRLAKPLDKQLVGQLAGQLVGQLVGQLDRQPKIANLKSKIGTDESTPPQSHHFGEWSLGQGRPATRRNTSGKIGTDSDTNLGANLGANWGAN